MPHNFDDDNWEVHVKRTARSRKNNDLVLIALLSVFFVLLVIGGFMYYDYYTGGSTIGSGEVIIENDPTITPVPIGSEEPMPTPTPVDPEYAAATADMTEEEKAQYDAYLEFYNRYLEAEMTNPIIQTVYQEPTVYSDTLVFILSFDNQPLMTDASTWSNFFYGQGGYYGTGSVKEYYREVSHGRIAIRPAQETQGTANDGVIRLSMGQHPRFTGAYYNSADQTAVMDTIYSFVKQVLSKGSEYVDYSRYDKDGDGDVEDNELDIVMIFAGYEDAYAQGYIPNATYSAEVWFNTRTINLDGVSMNAAIMTAELNPIIDRDVPVSPMGAICHEMGHAMGLPDLYDTDYSSEGLAFHSLMASGSYNYFGGEMGTMPPPLMAWSLVKLGALEPEVVTEDGVFYLWSRSSENYNVVKIPTQYGYYLIENVDFEGYGQGLGLYVQEPGIAIWYIDNEVMNSLYATYRFAVNDDEFRPGVRLVEPNNKSDLLHGNFDYQQVYDHYFRLSGDSRYSGAHGVIIDILDDPGEVMRIQVKIVR